MLMHQITTLMLSSLGTLHPRFSVQFDCDILHYGISALDIFQRQRFCLYKIYLFRMSKKQIRGANSCANASMNVHQHLRVRMPTYVMAVLVLIEN